MQVESPISDSTKPFRLIDTPQALAEVQDQLFAQAILGVDTEFRRERTFHALLALVQFSNGEHSWLLDPLAVDMSEIFQHFHKNKTTLVFHSASQDI